MLDPLLLRSFVAIVDSGSFTRAGERVHLTQSTISQQMRRLEQQLGCSLLDRSGRQVVTTAEGEKLLGLARSILALLARAEEQVAEASLQLSLGVPEDFAAGAIAPVLAAFARDYPQVRLEVHSGLSHEIWQRFEAGELDLALVKQARGQGGAARLLARAAGLGRQPCLARQRAGSLAAGGVPERRALSTAGDRGTRWDGGDAGASPTSAPAWPACRGRWSRDRGQLAAPALAAAGSAGADPLAGGGAGGAGAAPGGGARRAAHAPLARPSSACAIG